MTEPEILVTAEQAAEMLVSQPDIALLYALWTVQDNLLQYYRTMFITAASLLIGLAASAKHVVPTTTLIILTFILLVVWHLTTKARARNVQFVQQMIRWHEAGLYVLTPFTDFKKFQDWDAKLAYVVHFFGGHSENFTAESAWPPRSWNVMKWSARLHMELAAPITYAVCGVVIFVWSIASSP
jgi:hypothetical protein